MSLNLLVRLYTFILFMQFGALLNTPALAQNQNPDQIKKELEQLKKDNQIEPATKLAFKLADTYWKQKKFKEAIDAFEDGIDLSTSIKNDALTQDGYYALGLLNKDIQEYNDAIRSFKKSIDYSSKLNDHISTAQAHLQIGTLYSIQNKNRRAIDEMESALKLAIEKDLENITIESYAQLAKIYKETGNEAKYKEYTNNLALLKSDSEMKEEIEKIESQINSVQNQLSNKDKALEMANDSLNKVQEITNEQRLQIDLLSIEKDLTDMTIQAQEAELKNNRLTRNYLILVVLLALAFGVFVFIGYRNKIKVNKKIHEQHLNITSSINYAQRIQQAMLPDVNLLAKLLPDSFVLFKPRDVVSGDFYWAKELETSDDQFAIAAVDCTGHGVPGAFMSMVGMNALNSITGKGVTSASEILSQLHKEIHTSLKQSESGNKDGMDLALCTVDRKKKMVTYAGAKNALIYIKDGEISQIRADKHPIGGGKYEELKFTEHQIPIEGDMTFYMYSDGYVDQFGGPKNMKFMSKKFRELILRISHLPLSEQKERLEGEFIKWKGSGRQIDDVLVVGFKV
ncbi:SpoIIE family protein phosphatase [Fulvivirga lutimaris]|uniref:SpoIIE family protein phosphatase n=1 Tax=Fulvivirga lutimaris TaxID=1819566 RepID=UPI0012BCC284|nr:SpoIIE family protein phosphatase [Fulvivirga lutimaris]MTI39165.1 hypothetical protein [Fulvivirga lutimaris]